MGFNPCLWLMSYCCRVPDMVTIPTQLAAALREQRRRKDLTLASVGDHVGYTGSWIGSIELGKGRLVERTKLLDWLELLEIEPADYGIAVADAGPVWTLPSEFNRVPRPDRVRAEKFLAWVFQMRDVHR